MHRNEYTYDGQRRNFSIYKNSPTYYEEYSLRRIFGEKKKDNRLDVDDYSKEYNVRCKYARDLRRRKDNFYDYEQTHRTTHRIDRFPHGSSFCNGGQRDSFDLPHTDSSYKSYQNQTGRSYATHLKRKRSPSSASRCGTVRRKSDVCHEDGHYRVVVGKHLSSNYVVTKKLGKGTFGQVVQCWDYKRGKAVAVKIIKDVEKYRVAAEVEVEVLQFINSRASHKENYIVRLLDTFDLHGHVCLVFELLSLSLYDFMKSTSFQPFPIHQIQCICRQLLSAVNFLHTLSLTHTDLKPENIMLLDAKSFELKHGAKVYRILETCDIKVIDLGSATFENRHHARTVSTRHYRAPEVILGLGWSYQCDVWSIGCILYELYTGKAAFNTHDNLEHLSMMEVILGPLPRRMLENSTKYSSRGRLNVKSLSTESVTYVVKNCRPLKNILVEQRNPLDQQFLDLLQRMLTYEPEKRISCAEALLHPFLSSRSCANL